MTAKPDMASLSDDETVALMEGIARGITALLPDGTHFVVLVAGDDKRCNYISNVMREDVIKFMRETADRLQYKMDQPR